MPCKKKKCNTDWLSLFRLERNQIGNTSVKLFKNQVGFESEILRKICRLEFQKIEQSQTLINYIGDIIKKRRKDML